MGRLAAIFAGGTMLSRVLGVVRDAVLAAAIPAASLDAFLAAFRLPNMFREMLGEGATNAALVPVLTEANAQDDAATYRRRIGAVATTMLLIFSGVTLAAVAAIPLLLPNALGGLAGILGSTSRDAEDLAATVRLAQAVFPYLVLIGLTATLTAPLFVAKHYSTPGWAPALLNVALIAGALLLAPQFVEPAWALAIAVLVGGGAQLAAMVIAVWLRVGPVWPRFAFRDPAVQRSMALLGPVVVGQAAPQISRIIDVLFALALPVGSVTVLSLGNRLMQLPLSVFGVAIAVAVLPRLSEQHVRGETGALRRTLADGYRQTFFWCFPAMLGLIILADPIARLLFQRGAFGPDLAMQTASALRIYSAGLISLAWLRISAQGFFAVHDTITPVVVASLSVVLNVALNFALAGPFGYRGLAAAGTLAFSANAIAMLFLVARKHGSAFDGATCLSLAKIAFASLCLAGWTAGAMAIVRDALPDSGFGFRILAVAIPVATGGGIYLAVAFALGVPEARGLAARGGHTAMTGR